MCIYIIKRRPESVIERFNTVTAGEIAISSISIYELAYGASKSVKQTQSFKALADFLAPLVCLPFDEEDAKEAGQIRASLARSGQPIGPYDLQIAGQTRRRNLILVTNNMDEFKRVEGLRLENWV